MAITYLWASLALLAATASAQPFLPGTGFLPLGACDSSVFLIFLLWRNRCPIDQENFACRGENPRSIFVLFLGLHLVCFWSQAICARLTMAVPTTSRSSQHRPTRFRVSFLDVGSDGSRCSICARVHACSPVFKGRIMHTSAKHAWWHFAATVAEIARGTLLCRRPGREAELH